MKPSPLFDRIKKNAKKETGIIFDEIKCPPKEVGGIIKNDKLLKMPGELLVFNKRFFFLFLLIIRRIINCNRIVFVF